MKLYALICSAGLFLMSCKIVNQLRYRASSSKTTVSKIESYQDIPFSISNGLIILPVTIEGKIYHFIFDTGMPATIISGEVLHALKQKINDTISIKENVKVKANRFHVLNNVLIGNIEFDNVPCLENAMNTFSKATGRTVDGIIGNSMMRKAIWGFNFQKNMCKISTTLNLQETAGIFHL
jgi:Aspartyl protease